MSKKDLLNKIEHLSYRVEDLERKISSLTQDLEYRRVISKTIFSATPVDLPSLRDTQEMLLDFLGVERVQVIPSMALVKKSDVKDKEE